MSKTSTTKKATVKLTDKQMINTLNQMSVLNASIKQLESTYKDLSAKVENTAGSGTHHYGMWSVSVTDEVVQRFDSTQFKVDHPEFIQPYTKESNRHTMKIVQLTPEMK